MDRRLKDLVERLLNRGEPRRVRHHVVPRFYLERFAEDGKLGCWDITTGNLSERSPKKSSVIKDFYTIYDKAGQPHDLVEVKLLAEQVESPAAPPIERLLDGGELTDSDRSAISLFVGIQYVRGRRYPVPVEDSMEQLGKMVFRQAAGLIEMGYEVPGVREAIQEAYGREPTPEDYAEFVAAGRDTHKYKYEINRPTMLSLYMDHGAEVAKMLHQRKWQLVTFKDPVLITADEPVWLEFQGNTGPYGEGIGTVPGVWISLSTTSALRMGREDLDEIDPNTIDPTWINYELAVQAHHCLYGSPDLLKTLGYTREVDPATGGS